MINTVADAFTMVDEGIAAAARLLQGDLSVLLMPPSSGMNFVNALQKCGAPAIASPVMHRIW